MNKNKIVKAGVGVIVTGVVLTSIGFNGYVFFNSWYDQSQVDAYEEGYVQANEDVSGYVTEQVKRNGWIDLNIEDEIIRLQIPVQEDVEGDKTK